MLTNKLERKLYGHTEGVTCLRMTGYDVIVSGSNDFTIRLWNIKEGKCLMTITDHLAKLQDLTFNSRTKVLFSGSADGEVKVWKLNKLETSLKWMKTFQ
jgi:WD40 repeat protein